MNLDLVNSSREAIHPDFYPLPKVCNILHSNEYKKQYGEDEHDRVRRKAIEELNKLVDEIEE